jgi:RND superfamily putative drug exporter
MPIWTSGFARSKGAVMSQFLDRLGRVSARHPLRTLGIWVVIAFALIALSGSLGGEPVDNFRLPNSDAQRGLDVLERNFRTESGSSAYVVFNSRRGDLRRDTSRRDIAVVLARVGRLPHVVAVSDPFTTDAVSRDGTIALTEVRYDTTTQNLGRDAYTKLRATVRSDAHPEVAVELGGPLAAWEQTGGSTEWIGIVVAMFVLTLVFGSVLAMLLPLGLAVAALLIGQIALGVLAGVVDVPSSTPQLVTMIGLGVALDYSLFVVSRYLDRVRAGDSPEVAAGRATGTAGVAVLFAGSAVMIAICGLVLSGVVAIGIMGVGVALAVAVTVAAALTLLPALLGLLGRHASVSRFHWLQRSAAHEYRGARRWATTVVRHPVVATVGALAVLVLLASPVLSLRLGQTDAGTAPTSTSQRRAFDLLARGFGAGFNGPLLVVVDGSGVQQPGQLTGLGDAIAGDRGVAAVSQPRLNTAQNVAVFEAYPRTSPHSKATEALVRRLRQTVIPAQHADGVRVLVSGQTAAFVDIAQQMQSRLPLLIGAVVAVSFLLLMVGFRSVVVPLKAAIMNVLSIGVGYGVMVAVFQWGWGKELFGLSETVPIVSWVPLLMFAILFGLSMDYEVFLISAIRDAYRRHGDNRQAVIDGLSTTGRIITAAALIMFSVFVAFVAFPDPVVKMVGLGLAVSILIDATIVRMALVPAAMVLLGDANWWLPRWLDRILPSVDLEGERTDTIDSWSLPIEPEQVEAVVRGGERVEVGS